ncbi:hypothetical protein D8674_004379 [Pyrus ussuriensis x Pyrus communis]|uniref:Transposase-associated domain-containing protein n=1 Tax=Pyrus ussuriensis x Pyrus communis TaxID=2448454 RepID=A0A5N5FYI3_9ROSA|nr:hypothetical protein D8674_004379 [Pyrus ussuriensis x Pyrus communis]
MFLKHRFCDAFIACVNLFILAAKKHLNEEYKTHCPCRDCLNGNLHSLHVIRSHLYNSRFALHYKVWTLQGEFQESGSSAQIEDDSQNDSDSEDNDDNEMFEMLHDFQGPADMGTNFNATSGNDKSHASKYEYLFGKAQRELCPGCENFSVLSFIVELMHIKCFSFISNKHFDMLLNLLKRSHPKEASIPSTKNDAKKMPRKLGLGYESIHACKNDCALFWKTNEKLDKCPECGEPSEATTDNPQIRDAVVIPSSNTVAAIISSTNTQGSANGVLFYSKKMYERAKLKWEEMLSIKNETTLLDGIVTLTDDEIVLGVLGHKSGYFKGLSKSVSLEDTMLDKHLEEKLETQQ